MTLIIIPIPIFLAITVLLSRCCSLELSGVSLVSVRNINVIVFTHISTSLYLDQDYISYGLVKLIYI
jgi:hypothetical protein